MPQAAGYAASEFRTQLPRPATTRARRPLSSSLIGLLITIIMSSRLVALSSDPRDASKVKKLSELRSEKDDAKEKQPDVRVFSHAWAHS